MNCASCNSPDELSIFSRVERKDGSYYVRYMCRPCRRVRWHEWKYGKPTPPPISAGMQKNLSIMRKYA